MFVNKTIKKPDDLLKTYITLIDLPNQTNYFFFNLFKTPTLPKGELVLTKYKKEISKSYLTKLLILSQMELIPKIFVFGNNYIISKYLKDYKSLRYLENKNFSDYLDHRKEIKKNSFNAIKKWYILKYANNNITKDNVLIDSKYNVLFINPLESNDLDQDVYQIKKII